MKFTIEINDTELVEIVSIEDIKKRNYYSFVIEPYIVWCLNIEVSFSDDVLGKLISKFDTYSATRTSGMFQKFCGVQVEECRYTETFLLSD